MTKYLFIFQVFDLVRYAVPHMPKGSAIINVGSIQAYDPSYEILDYATTKAAIVGFTKGLADKLLEKGIRVNAVAVNKKFFFVLFHIKF